MDANTITVVIAIGPDACLRPDRGEGRRFTGRSFTPAGFCRRV